VTANHAEMAPSGVHCRVEHRIRA